MLSMEPAIKRGLTFWDQALMPRDEFSERIRLVRAGLREAGLDALIVAGNMYEDADLIYLVGGSVDGTLLVPLEGEPAIFTVSGGREVPFMKGLTWIEQMKSTGPMVGKALAAALAERGLSEGRLGTVGLQVLAHQPYEDLTRSLHGFALEDFTPTLHRLRAKLRPRELTAIRLALGMAETALAAAEAAFADGASNAAAVVAAERAARAAGSWDFRALANLAGDDLRPFERPSSDRRTPLLLWVATRYQGYWADGVAGAAKGADTEAGRAVAAMVAAAKTGASASAVAEAGLASLSEASRRSALAYGLGQGLGTALNGAPRIGLANNESLAAEALLSFRIFAAGGEHPSLAGAVIQVGPEGGRPLRALERLRP